MGRNSSDARRPNSGRARWLLALIVICLAAGITATGDFHYLGMVAAAMFGAVAGIVALGRHQRARAYRERSNAAESLSQSEAQTSAMFDLASVGIAQADPRTGRFLRVNRKMCAITGYGTDELLGMRIAEITHPDDRQADSEAAQRVVRGEQPDYRMEKRYVRKDGTVAWVNVNMTVIRDAAGEPTRTVATIEDITERRQAGRSLLASESRYRRLFEAARDGILFLDAKTGMTLDVNPYLVELLGFAREQFLAKRIWELGPFEEIFANEDAFRRILEERDVRYEDKPLKSADGRRIAVEFASSVYHVDLQTVIQCHVRDISTRQRAEEALRSADQRMRRLAESDIIGIVTADAAGQITEANDYYLRLTGCSREELASGRIDWRALTPPEWLHADEHALDELRERGTCTAYEKEYVRRDGTRVPVLLVDAVLPGPEEQLVALVLDLTERKRAEEARDKLQTQLVQAGKMEAVGSLAGGVAHDFNNMLTVVKGCAEMAMEKLPPADPARIEVAEILAAADRSEALVRQLLAFARKQTIAPKVLDLNAAIAPMLSMLRRLIGEDVELTWKPGANLESVKLDPSQIGQLLANLVINARDAVAGVGRVAIETAATRSDETECTLRPYFVPGTYVVLRVSDDGCGMDEKVRAQIFEPFFSTKPRGQGTGLGLATVYGIVKQNGGFIDVYSEPGQGATFAIYLPAHEPEASLVTADPREPASIDAPSGPRTVLLVEDDVALLALSRRMLEGLGYTVLAAGDPIEAIELLKAFTGEIHLLMTDVVMPKMNGRQLQGALTALRPGLKCLFTSGYTSDIIADRGVLDEGIQFLQKPFSQMTLAEKVREAMG
jgi:PAS domain S-box-containing protein